MRNSTDICLLCKENNSTQKNSHIVPKVFGKGIFEGANPRHGLEINGIGHTVKIQDISKEDYLFCPTCEKGFSIFENYCYFRLEQYNKSRCYNKFKPYKQGEFEFFECKDLDIRIYNLFIFSMIWRISACDDNSFKKFKLPEIEEEILRNILKSYIYCSQKDLVDNINNLNTLPNHSHVIIRPRKKMRPPNSMLSAMSLNDYIHQLHLVDYIVFYVTDQKILIRQFKDIDNNNLTRLVHVGITDQNKWSEFNFELIRKLIRIE